MKLWVISVGEPIPVIEGNVREMRSSMLIRYALAAGHEVVRWSSTFVHRDKRHLFPGSTSMPGGGRLGYRFFHGPGYARNRSLQRVRHHRVEMREFRRMAAAEAAPDAIFCCLPTIDAAEAAVEYGNSHGVPVVVDVRDLWPDVFLSVLPPWLRPLGRAGLALERPRLARLFAGCGRITAISQKYLDWAAAHASRGGRAPAGSVFPIGYEKPAGAGGDAGADEEFRRRVGIPPGAFVVVFTGTLVSSFDFHTVLRAARTLQDGGRTDIEILFAGGGTAEAELRAAASGLRHVRFTGWLTPPELNSALRISRAGLCPYRRGAAMSLPNKPYEYMAWGLPLLSSLGGELEELVRRHEIGIHYVADDSGELATAIRRLVDEPGTRQRLASNSRALFENRYSADRIYPGFVSFLEAACSG